MSIRDEVIAEKKTIAYCKKFDVSAKIAKRIHEELGIDSCKWLITDPFQIVDIPFVTIEHANKMADHIPADDIRRLRAYIIVSLKDVLGDAIEYRNNSGDAWVKLPQLKRAFAKRFKGFNFEECLEASKAVVDGDKVSSEKLTSSEMLIAEKCIATTDEIAYSDYDSIHGAVVERLENTDYSDEQKNAIANSVAYRFSVVTGGAGTGKTKTINGIISTNKSVMVLAPTGKAAKRAIQLTDHNAYTIHLAILSPKIGEILEGVSVVVIDEASMMDTVIFSRLLSFLDYNNPDCRVVLVGDENQLKSVGAGAVLRDVIASNTIPVQKLNQNFRQGAGSLIAENAKKIWAGYTNLVEKAGAFEIVEVSDMVDMWQILKNNPTPYPIISAENHLFGWGVQPLNFMLQQWHNPLNSAGAETIYNHYKNKKEVIYLLEDIPKRGFYAGDVGRIIEVKRGKRQIVLEINKSQFTITNDEFERKVRHQKVFRPNDPIMQLANNREIGLVNGDIGTVLTVSEKTMTADFDGRMVTFKRDKRGIFDDLTLARVFTCHKCQGDEYPEVTILLTKGFYREAMNRDWLGTAVTRAKGKVTIIHDGCLNQIIMRKARKRKTRVVEFVDRMK